MIDVIIPVYNARKYLPQALDSILIQTIKDNCLITIIDDGSTDDYADILKKYQKLNINYVKLKKNYGVGISRKKALKITNNEYIIFLDSDDCFIDNKAVEKLYNSIKNKKKVIAKELIKNQEVIHYGNLHAKMYRRSILKEHKITFTKMKHSEDLEFNIKYILSLKNDDIVEIPNLIYKWQELNAKSLTKIHIDDMHEYFLDCIIKLKKYFITTKNLQYKEILIRALVNSINKMYLEKIIKKDEYTRSIYLKKVKKIIDIFKTFDIRSQLLVEINNNLDLL